MSPLTAVLTALLLGVQAPGHPSPPESEAVPAQALDSSTPLPVSLQAPSPASPKRSIWRDSRVVLGMSLENLQQPIARFDEELWMTFHNHLLVEPHLWPTDWLELHGRIGVGTQLLAAVGPGWNNDQEVASPQLEDALLGVATPGVLLPLDLRVSGGLHVLLPTSELSRSWELRAAPGASLTLSRAFPVLAGLTLAYSGRFSFTFFRYTTITDCSNPTCGDGGWRASWGILSHGPELKLQLLPRLGLEAALHVQSLFIHGFTRPPLQSSDAVIRSTVGYQVAVRYAVADFLAVRFEATNEPSAPLPELLPSGTSWPRLALACELSIEPLLGL